MYGVNAGVCVNVTVIVDVKLTRCGDGDIDIARFCSVAVCIVGCGVMCLFGDGVVDIIVHVIGGSSGSSILGTSSGH